MSQLLEKYLYLSPALTKINEVILAMDIGLNTNAVHVDSVT